jgi:hypothetical protein
LKLTEIGAARLMVATHHHFSDLATLTAVIARSQIIAVEPAKILPDGYGDVDVAILEWIAAEGRRSGVSFVRM